ncbi:MerR family transcriptional regulator [Tardiphaga alba]|uniref:MerR family transcriptional regulator n=1 Tax=Tardiphaga alba TaxID=340268 RepID=UPI0038B61635
MDKAPDAFRTISEVADDLDIPQHVLRFWETRFSQIKPMKRSGGRRYYRPDDVDLLRGIRRLLYGEGYTIRGVQRILKENGIKAVQGLVDEEATPAFAPVPARASEPRMSSAAPLMSRPAAKAPVVEEEPEEEDVEEKLEDEEAEDEEASDEESEDAEEEDESDEDESEDGDDEESEEEADEEDGEEEEEDEEAEAEVSEDDSAEEEEAEPEPVAARKAPDVRPPEVRTDPAMRATPRVEPRLQQAIGRTDPATMSRANPMPTARANPAPQPRENPQPAPSPRPAVRLRDRERLEAVLEELLAARRALDAAMKDGGT